jgi:hypothetical protein
MEYIVSAQPDSSSRSPMTLSLESREGFQHSSDRTWTVMSEGNGNQWRKGPVLSKFVCHLTIFSEGVRISLFEENSLFQGVNRLTSCRQLGRILKVQHIWWIPSRWWNNLTNSIFFGFFADARVVR